MFRFSLPRAALFILLSVTFCASSFAQLCGPPLYPPCPTPTPAPTPAPTAPASTPTAPTQTPAPTSAPTAGTTAAPAAPTGTPGTSVTNIPGYTPSGSYSTGRTVAYIIAPFAIVAGTYFLGHHHQIEIHPNAGFFWPRQVDSTHLRDEGIYGLKASASVTDNVRVEGSFGYINHFESRFAPTKLDQSFGIAPRTVHGLLYDVNGVFEFGQPPIFGRRVSPYVTAGVGGLSTQVRQDTGAVVGGEFYTTNPTTGTVVLNSGRKIIVADNTPFFTVNYGGGVKATNLWGPVGVRVDVRGRTFPNFRGEVLTWPEATAGLTFTFGER
ncbi:MAG: hypothetical protein DMG14_34925 [Acidobacteria bacterium]|nr:MAG: hypothetical protein DMG14_34925 [Acidobacteriota bacterium]